MNDFVVRFDASLMHISCGQGVRVIHRCFEQVVPAFRTFLHAKGCHNIATDPFLFQKQELLKCVAAF